jgi:hypothetical protein
MIRRVIFGFSKDFYGEHMQNETSTLANTDATSVCWLMTSDDQLDRPTVHGRNAGAQGFVAANDFVQRPRRNRRIQPSAQSERDVQIKKRILGQNLIHKPQALLPE